MMYNDGTVIVYGDVVKYVDDSRFTGSPGDGHMLALCRHATVRAVWPNNEQISVRFSKMQDVMYAITNPDRIERSIFEHDVYVNPDEVQFVARGEMNAV